MNKKIKYIVFLGTGDHGAKKITWARNYGFKTISINKKKSSKSNKLADESLCLDSRDYKKIIDKIKNKNIKYVISSNDFSINSQNKILNYFKKKISKLQIDKVNNKLYQKKIFNQNNIKCPPYSILKLNSFENKKKIKFPIIIKPFDSSGSQGVKFINNLNEIKKYLEKTSYNEFLVEKIIYGKHIDFNALTWGGNCRLISLSERKFTPYPYCVPIKYIENPVINKAVLKKVNFLIKKISKSMQLVNTPFKGDLIITKDEEVFVLEATTRFHGDVGSVLASELSLNLTPYHILYKTIADQKLPTEIIKKNFAKKSFVFTHAIRNSFKNFKQAQKKLNRFIKKNKSVHYFLDQRKVINSKKELTSTNNIFGYIIYYEKTLKMLKEKEKLIKKKLNIF